MVSSSAMKSSSGYGFPIFVSSTDYNLVDLRAELAHFLREGGYEPVLSSERGFPDQAPHLAPHESCLARMRNCFLMILVIDGRYGPPLEWIEFNDEVRGERVSATHGEYRFARAIRLRTLVFVRRGLLAAYSDATRSVIPT